MSKKGLGKKRQCTESLSKKGGNIEEIKSLAGRPGAGPTCGEREGRARLPFRREKKGKAVTRAEKRGQCFGEKGEFPHHPAKQFQRCHQKEHMRKRKKSDRAPAGLGKKKFLNAPEKRV